MVWHTKVTTPIRQHGISVPELVKLQSSYRTVIPPTMDYVLKLEADDPTRKVVVIVPELVVRHWWENLLHNQRTQVLKLPLLVRGNQRSVVVNIPRYL